MSRIQKIYIICNIFRFHELFYKLDCSNLLMTFLIKSCLNGPPKIWKLWSEIMEKFNEKAPLLLKYQTLTLEEHIADQVLEKLNHSDNEDLTGVQFNNLAVHICKTLTESLPMQNLSQESPTSMRFDPSSKVTKIIKVLVTLIEKLSSYNTVSLKIIGEILRYYYYLHIFIVYFNFFRAKTKKPQHIHWLPNYQMFCPKLQILQFWEDCLNLSAHHWA